MPPGGPHPQGGPVPFLGKERARRYVVVTWP